MHEPIFTLYQPHAADPIISEPFQILKIIIIIKTQQTDKQTKEYYFEKATEPVNSFMPASN